ncbi:MAG: hypothetical protein RHS_3206 [Robinsoniella sp. RHS]|nr:MAG: hypothetical protein RHS_3206 [Robinsoniella sp. RHS]
MVTLQLQKKGGDVMNTYQVLTLLFIFGSFLISLLAYIDKKK